MADPTIRIEGIEDIQRIFGKIPPAVKAAIKAAAVMFKGYRTQYPTGEWGYKRTRKLANSWNVRETNGGAGAVVGSSTEAVHYNRIVADREVQALVHEAHGWHTVQDDVEEHGPEVTEMVHDAIEQVTG